MSTGITFCGTSHEDEGSIGHSISDDVWIPNHGRDNGRSVGKDECHFLNLEKLESTYFVIVLDSVAVYASLICPTAYQSLLLYRNTSLLAGQEGSTGSIYSAHNYFVLRQTLYHQHRLLLGRSRPRILLFYYFTASSTVKATT